MNPRKLHRFKEIYSLTGQKDDRYDAKMIALYVLKNINTCQNKKIRNEESSRLMKLNSNLDILKKDRARLVKSFKKQSTIIFPLFFKVF
ncbi:transposase domain protein [Leptospira vanthielii serovar Holland str. Waz Holland = ATCC 700522]|uniref:Transposase domain protein n=1 Tax=Leptospira vanthielii serovar Holland str. Waz Holland = ATCC 700522 TaxID=1218591 RepID=N1WD76_9LEPT|nr:transposase domain protein [Leptospira vanthielii serovar Holland str. Waz Holland = ATCC 700522]